MLAPSSSSFVIMNGFVSPVCAQRAHSKRDERKLAHHHARQATFLSSGSRRSADCASRPHVEMLSSWGFVVNQLSKETDFVNV